MRLYHFEATNIPLLNEQEQTDTQNVGLLFYHFSPLRVASESPDSGEGFDELRIDYAGPTFTIGFNARYFLDVLTALDEEEVELGLGGELDPAVVRPVSERRFVGVIMPMRI